MTSASLKPCVVCRRGFLLCGAVKERCLCTVRKCHVNKGDLVPLPWPPIAIQIPPLPLDITTSQLLSSVLLCYQLVNQRDCLPCSAL